MIKLRKFRKKDTKTVSLLIINTFKKFNSNSYFEKKGVNNFINIFDSKKNTTDQIYNHFLKTPFFYIATDNDNIIGVIRGKLGRISNLFIDGNYHKRGIGKLLLKKFELEMKKQKVKKIKLRASLFAVPFYQKMGYTKTTGVRNFKGLKVCPMRKFL